MNESKYQRCAQALVDAHVMWNASQMVRLMGERGESFWHLDSEALCNLFFVTDGNGEIYEVHEQIFVDDWLADALMDVGETVVEDLFGWGLPGIWCRTQSGQALCMDACIREIIDRLPDTHWIRAELAA